VAGLESGGAHADAPPLPALLWGLRRRLPAPGHRWALHPQPGPQTFLGRVGSRATDPCALATGLLGHEVTVYVYKMRHQGMFVTREMSDPWYGLTADTANELHAFAAQLGIPRQGFEPVAKCPAVRESTWQRAQRMVGFLTN
jgi:hypothetical protein